MKGIYAGLVAMSLLLSGCDRGLAICEEHIKSGLRSPSTFHRINYKKTVLKVRAPEPRRPAAGNTNILEAAQHDAWLENPWLYVSRYVIESDADNSFGVPIRSSEVCEFDTKLISGLGWDFSTGTTSAAVQKRSLLSQADFRRSVRAAFRDDPTGEESDMSAVGKAVEHDGRPDCCR